MDIPQDFSNFYGLAVKKGSIALQKLFFFGWFFWFAEKS